MRARLERGVQRRAARGVTRPRERVHLGVRLARSVVIALADDLAAADDDRAHHRVGARPARGARREAQRALHVLGVFVDHRL